MKIEETLQNIGFSKAESKVYLALQTFGETKAGKIIKQTGLQSSVVHNSLNSLQEKGFITSILIGKIKHYQALKPTLIRESLENKKKEFEKTIPLIEGLQKNNEFLPRTEVFTGIKGLFSAINKMIENPKKKEEFLYFAIEEKQTTEEILDFFAKIDLIKKEKGIITKGISNKENKNLKQYKNSEIKFSNQEIPPAMNIYDNKVLFYSFEGKPTGILIESEQIANQYKKLWHNIWTKTSPPKF